MGLQPGPCAVSVKCGGGLVIQKPPEALLQCMASINNSLEYKGILNKNVVYGFFNRIVT